MILSYIATALVLIGVYLISRPRIEGQYVMLLADVTWLAYAIITKQWPLALQSIVLLTFAISAIRNWRKKGVG